MDSNRRQSSKRKETPRRTGPKQVIIPEEPTDEERAALLSRAMYTAIWHIERTRKTSGQIREVLRRKAFTDEYIDHTIARLIEINLLDDRAYAHDYVNSRKKSRGDRSLRNELRTKGMPVELIEEALEEELSEDDQEDAALMLARKKAASIPRDLDNQKKTQRIVGTLIRRGFSPSVAFGLAKQVIQELVEESE